MSKGSADARIGRSVLEILAACPDGRSAEADIREAMALAAARSGEADAGDEITEQRLRTLRANRSTPGNIIGYGYVRVTKAGVWELTDAGRDYVDGGYGVSTTWRDAC